MNRKTGGVAALAMATAILAAVPAAAQEADGQTLAGAISAGKATTAETEKAAAIPT